ncbi:hypothetical protein LTR17_000493 [Elasticomyces elasticus]|nr:hypothetical protein LTR17_000493 [Elasticomyces elasticus]
MPMLDADLQDPKGVGRKDFSAPEGVAGIDKDFSWTEDGPWFSRRVLSLHGDGSRGLFILYVLQDLMDCIATTERMSSPPAYSSTSSPHFRALRSSLVISTLSSDAAVESIRSPQYYRPCHYFDFISGVGVGGMVAVMLGVMRLTVEETVERTERLFADFGDPVQRPLSPFGVSHRKTRNSKRMQLELQRQLEKPARVAQQSVGAGGSIGNVSQAAASTLEVDRDACQTIVFAAHKVRKGLTQLYIFRSYVAPMAVSGKSHQDTRNVQIVDACRATLARPSTFRSVEIPEFSGSFRDASSLLELDPPMEAYREMRRLRAYNPVGLQCLLSIGAEGSTSSKATKPTTHTELPVPRDGVAAKAQKHRFDYGSFVLRDVDLIDTTDTIQGVKRNAEKFRKERYGDILEWAKRLVKYRRDRAETVNWDRYAGLRLACHVCTLTFERSELTRHMELEHSKVVRT